MLFGSLFSSIFFWFCLRINCILYLLSPIQFCFWRNRYLNDVDYYGGFEQDELDELFEAMQSNYKAWCLGFAPLCVGGDMESVAVQEFNKTL